MFGELKEQVFGFRRPRLPLRSRPLPLTELQRPGLLSFVLAGGDNTPYKAVVKAGDEINPGTFLADDGKRPAVVSPVKGKVAGIAAVSPIRGGGMVKAALIEPAADSSPKVFAPINAASAPVEKLWERIAEAGILTDSLTPRPLSEVVGPAAGSFQTLIILAADREPEVCSALAVFSARIKDVGAAAALLKKLTGAAKVLIASYNNMLSEAKGSLGDAGTLAVEANYPSTLEPMLALRVGGEVKTISVECALACLDAVRDGKVQEMKAVTLIGATGRARMNFMVPLGTRFSDLLASAGIAARDRDKIVAGGPLRGFAQYSLDGSVDQGVDAVMIVPAELTVAWTNEPCVSCGACPRVCPTKLQPQLLGRYAEFSLFDRTEELGIDNCIECGLCAMVCTARRPLLQWIRLAKKELNKKRAAQAVSEAAACAEEGKEAGK